jgi:TRAP-type C4-dicarboxylate transport system permease small subunit
MKKSTRTKFIATIITLGLPLFLTSTALAATGNVSSVSTFLQNIIQAMAGLAGLTATGFFVIGGFSYITSSGNPEHLEKAKRTLLYSSVGLAITIAAFALSTIVTSLATSAFGS